MKRQVSIVWPMQWTWVAGEWTEHGLRSVVTYSAPGWPFLAGALGLALATVSWTRLSPRAASSLGVGLAAAATAAVAVAVAVAGLYAAWFGYKREWSFGWIALCANGFAPALVSSASLVIGFRRRAPHQLTCLAASMLAAAPTAFVVLTIAEERPSFVVQASPHQHLGRSQVVRASVYRSPPTPYRLETEVVTVPPSEVPTVTEVRFEATGGLVSMTKAVWIRHGRELGSPRLPLAEGNRWTFVLDTGGSVGEVVLELGSLFEEGPLRYVELKGSSDRLYAFEGEIWIGNRAKRPRPLFVDPALVSMDTLEGATHRWSPAAPGAPFMFAFSPNLVCTETAELGGEIELPAPTSCRGRLAPSIRGGIIGALAAAFTGGIALASPGMIDPGSTAHLTLRSSSTGPPDGRAIPSAPP